MAVRVVTTPVQVRFADVDMARHVHNAVYLTYFELARMAYLAPLFGPEHDWTTEGLILGRNEVDYRRPVRLHDRVEVDCWCTRVGGKSFELAYGVHVLDGTARTLCAEGRSVMVCFNYLTHATIPIPERIRIVLEQDARP
ncbi:MAG: acyl-CoA thioesterase [Flavobacteriales bacterium]|nr:acyl-CoA thioesterase [Flavobacteriales bacterium]